MVGQIGDFSGIEIRKSHLIPKGMAYVTPAVPTLYDLGEAGRVWIIGIGPEPKLTLWQKVKRIVRIALVGWS
jgi:hypothetical protein